METVEWILVLAAIATGILLGVLASKVVQSILSADTKPEALQKSAKSIAGLVFWIFAAAGLVFALGILDQKALEQLPKDFVALLPKLMVAAIIVIGANVLSAVVETAMSPSLARMPVNTQLRVNQAVKGSIVALATLMAVRQIGVDTTILNMALAALFFAIAGSLTLLIGFGGRRVASEVASTRAIRRLISEGDTVELGPIRGEVVAIHPTTVEVLSNDGVTELVPASKFAHESVSVVRKPAE